MGYQRGERGRFASLVTVIVLGAGVLSIDHITGRSVRPPARTEPANQVISMDVAAASQSDAPDLIGCDGTLPRFIPDQQSGHAKRPASRSSSKTPAPVTNAIKLKVQEALESNALLQSRMVYVRNNEVNKIAQIGTRISEMSKRACFLELQLDSIPPLEKRLIAAASQMPAVRSVSICIDGEVRISKARPTAPAQLYLIRATSELKTKARERQVRLAIPAPPTDWKCGKSTS
jgi:hypothetical protein